MLIQSPMAADKITLYVQSCLRPETVRIECDHAQKETRTPMRPDESTGICKSREGGDLTSARSEPRTRCSMESALLATLTKFYFEGLRTYRTESDESQCVKFAEILREIAQLSTNSELIGMGEKVYQKLCNVAAKRTNELKQHMREELRKSFISQMEIRKSENVIKPRNPHSSRRETAKMEARLSRAMLDKATEFKDELLRATLSIFYVVVSRINVANADGPDLMEL